MRMTRLSAVAVVAAVLGLVVSVAAAWPRQPPANPTGSLPGPLPTHEETAPGALPGGQSPGSVSARPGGAGPDPGTASSAGRGDASLPTRRTTTPRRPVQLAIPAVGYRAPVRPVGVAARGAMELPPDPAVLGWYRYGPTPTQPGSSVLAGHLDSVRYGLGPLVRLREVELDAEVKVTLAGGPTLDFVVVGVDRYDRTALPEELFAREGPRQLRIITCGGEYDADAGGYQSNLVVTAVPA